MALAALTLILSGLLRNGVLTWGHSSARSAMSIAQTVLAPSKLRQERHGEEDCIHPIGRALNPKHAAPDGAWVVFRGIAFYKHGAPNGAVPKRNSIENSEESSRRVLPSAPCPPPSRSRLWWHPGDTLVYTPCGSRNLLRCGHFCRNSCILRFSSCIRCVPLPNQILLSGERSRLAEPWTASTPRSRGHTGIVLLIRQPGAILP